MRAVRLHDTGLVVEEIEVPVAVVVPDGQAHAGLRHAVLAERRPALQRQVGKRAVVIVAIKDGCRRIGGDVHIGPAVLVEVRRRRDVYETGNVGCRTIIVKKEDDFGRMVTKRIRKCND